MANNDSNKVIDKNNNINIFKLSKKSLLIMIISMFSVVVVGTLSWFTWRSNESSLVLTVGEIGSLNISLYPYRVNSDITPSTSYEGDDGGNTYVQIDAINSASGKEYEMVLYYKINSIDEELADSAFKYTILSSDDNVTYTEYLEGNFSTATSNSEYPILGEFLKSNTSKYYRVYLWIDTTEGDQSLMQGKIFNAELRANYEENISDLTYSVVKLNNSSSSTIGNGFYNLSNYSCVNGTILDYDTYSKEITANGIDKCTLEFSDVPSYPKLYDIVEIGDYIAYTGVGNGDNKCSTTNQSSTDSSCINCNQCSGWNARQTDTDIYDNYGYCGLTDSNFITYGWRVLHKTDSSVYIVSAGAPECVASSYAENPQSTTSSLPFGSSSSYYYGTHYKFNLSTGKYSLDTTADGYTSVADIFSNLCTSESCSITDYYTCSSTSETGTCSTMYKIESYSSSTYANAYTYYNMSSSNDISQFNTTALKYCNALYLQGGECNQTTAHAFNGDDFYKFTSQYYGSSNARYLYSYNDGGTYGSLYCYSEYSNTYCGYNNTIIDNGGHYWFGSGYSSAYALDWSPSIRQVSYDSYASAYGVRPVLKLDSGILATGGIGTMDNPYTISTRNGDVN